jgi:hypothetical protein
MNADRGSVEWREIRPEKLYDVLATHMPICWNCHIAETFRREFNLVAAFEVQKID